jgi:hypothetical protein
VQIRERLRLKPSWALQIAVFGASYQPGDMLTADIKFTVFYEAGKAVRFPKHDLPNRILCLNVTCAELREAIQF